MVEHMRKMYLNTPTRETVDSLADEFGKRPRSIIAKLSNLEIYIAPVRTTKSGTPIIKKDELVKIISKAMKVELTSLIKANKQDLERLVTAIEVFTGTEK